MALQAENSIDALLKAAGIAEPYFAALQSEK